MREAGCRPKGRLCCWGLGLWLVCAVAYCASAAQSGPATTTISDTVYLADGTAASGVLIITWPAFVTAGGAQVAAGSKNVTLGAGGSLNVALVANAGATPAGVYYTTVYQLGPGEVKTETWVVPASASPVNLAAVRMTPGSGVAGQSVSMQYVNSELAAKANDNAVVHLSGSETIAGTKTFASAPSVPTPVNPGDVASKGYVDQAVSNVGVGNYLPTAGGTMTGPITLPANPAAPLQAATKSYVDSSLASKADLVAGLVPASELGTGTAAAGNCLTGNGTWAPCSAGGTGNLSTAPAASQTIAQPVGTQFSTNNLANIRYVTASWNWLQSPTDNLSTPGSNTIHLSACPLGLDTTSSTNHYTYKVYIAGTGTPEAAAVTGGSCAPGTSGGTIIVTTVYPHAAGYTVGSASGGIQEAWNDAWTSDYGTTASNDTAPYVKLMSDTNYNVYATVYLRGRGGVLDGAGALIVCSTRDRCFYVGTTQGAPFVNHHKLYNLSGTSVVNVDGVQIASVTATTGTYTITSASNHPFVVGDVVDCEYYSQNAGQHWASTVTAVGSATSFSVAFGSASFAAGANTFGFCGLLNTFVENNSDHVVLQDINLMQVPGLAMGQFSYGIVDDNDQQFIVQRATNRSSAIVRSDANFPMGAFVYQRTDQGNAGITYVHDSELTGVNCAQAGGNGFVMSDTVCQGFPVYGVRYFGGYQPATFTNVYQESTGGSTNPLYGYAAQMGYVVQGGVGTKFVGTFPTQGYEPVFASGGSGTNVRSYYVVPRSSTMGYGPLIFAGYAQPATSTTNVTVSWPSIELQDFYYHQSLGTLTWDILVTVGQSAVTPYGTGTYAIATNAGVSCGTNGMCLYTDTQATPVSYAVPAQQFTPVFWFWPENLVINDTTVFLDVAGGDPQALASQGATGLSIVAEQCQPQGASWRRNPIWVSCVAGPTNFGAGGFATVLQQQDASNNGPFANSKGRVNFGKPIGTPNDLITLADSNFLKTLATAGERPSNDAGDVAIGMDQAGGLSQRAGTSISSYINVVPNGTNFLERLTSSGDTLNVPLTVNGNLTVSSGTVSLPVTGTGPQCLHVSSTGVVSGTGADCGSGGGGSDPVMVNTGISAQLALYGANGSAVNGDSTLTDNGTTLNYSGTGGIAANSGTFSGNLTVNGQLQVAGPWAVSSPIPGTVMSASGPGTSSLGISDDGNFYISANGGTPQQVATAATSSYFTNLWQEDANDVGAFNGTNPQGLHVYGTYTNASNFERTGMGWDGTDNYFVLRTENAGTGQQRGVGFWIGSGIRWAIDTASAFKPFQNNSFDIGVSSQTSQLVPRTVYAGTSFDTLTSGRQNFELCNDGSTGTSQNFLAVYNGANPACAVKAGTSNTDGVIGVVSNGAGTTGSAVITYWGYVACSFDGSTTAGDFVAASTTNPGDCHDAGGTRPTAVQVLGRVESTNTGAGTYGIRMSLNGPAGSGGGLLNSPTFTGTVTLPDGTTDSSSGMTLGAALTLPSGSAATTQTAGDNSNKVATDAFVLANGGGVSGGSLYNLYGNNNGSKGTQTDAWAYFPDLATSGTDASTKTQTALAAANGVNGYGDTIYLDGFGPSQTWSVNPFAASSFPASGILHVPSMLASASAPIVPPNSSSQGGHWILQGVDGQGIASNSSRIQAASSSFPAGCSSCGSGATISAESSVASSVTVTASASVFSAADKGCVISSPSASGAGLGTNSWHGMISGYTSATQVTVYRVNVNGTGTSTASTFDMTCPLWGSDQDDLSIAAFAAKLDKVVLDANNLTGVNPADIFDSQEQTSITDVSSTNFTSHGLGIFAQNTGPFSGLNFCYGSSANANSVAVVDRVNGGSRGEIGNLTATKCSSSTRPNVHYDAETNNRFGHDFHFEDVGQYGLCLGCAPTLNVSAPVKNLNAHGSTWLSIYCGGASGSSTCVGLDEINGTSKQEGVNIFGVYTTSAFTNALKDGGAGNTLTQANNPYLGFYHTDGAGAVFSNANPADSGLTMVDVYNNNLSFLNGGTQEAQINGTTGAASFASLSVSGATALGAATATTPVTTDNSTNVATTAYVKGQSPGASVQYVVFPGYNSGNQAVFPTTANTAAVYSFELPFAVTTTKVAYKTGTTADNTSNTYEVGIYNASGALVLSYQAAGTSFAAAASTWYRQSWSQGSTTLAPGRYYEAITSSCSASCATFWGSSSTTAAYYSNSALGVTSGGTLPGSITVLSGYESFGANTLSIILE